MLQPSKLRLCLASPPLWAAHVWEWTPAAAVDGMRTLLNLRYAPSSAAEPQQVGAFPPAAAFYVAHEHPFRCPPGAPTLYLARGLLPSSYRQHYTVVMAPKKCFAYFQPVWTVHTEQSYPAILSPFFRRGCESMSSSFISYKASSVRINNFASPPPPLTPSSCRCIGGCTRCTRNTASWPPRHFGSSTAHHHHTRTHRVGENTKHPRRAFPYVRDNRIDTLPSKRRIVCSGSRGWSVVAPAPASPTLQLHKQHPSFSVLT